MKLIPLHPIIFYGFLFLLVAFMTAFCIVLWKYCKRLFTDVVIFIDKSNRWSMIREKVKDNSTYTYNGKKYFIGEGILNRTGKALFVFSEDKPQPLKIEYNTSKWVSSESMMSIINNKLIQQLVRTSDALSDKLMLFGAVGGMIAGVASVLILLKQFGVLK